MGHSRSFFPRDINKRGNCAITNCLSASMITTRQRTYILTGDWTGSQTKWPGKKAGNWRARINYEGFNIHLLWIQGNTNWITSISVIDFVFGLLGFYGTVSNALMCRVWLRISWGNSGVHGCKTSTAAKNKGQRWTTWLLAESCDWYRNG